METLTTNNDKIKTIDNLRLKKAGKNYLRRCYWHKEKTPSLTVNFELGKFYCFGCHRSGTIDELIKKGKQCQE